MDSTQLRAAARIVAGGSDASCRRRRHEHAPAARALRPQPSKPPTPRRRLDAVPPPTAEGDALTVDIVTEATINRTVDEVAAYAADPSNAPDWYVNIKSVEWETPPPVEKGSRA